ncbi:cytochrome-c oxidase, cbb3-type subunit III [Paracoccus sp. (in: a-proteobacteria)]|uniref:cytochrome-c oxidase, cbb3-type subunit III n=1 Tax=Paracoccus sp. TaxID=267 RepID=UPI00321F62CA
MSEHQQEIDPVTGYETTGHEWNGIKELNTPFPRIAIWALAITVVYAVVSWVLLPTWPMGRDYTRGLLGIDQKTDAQAAHARMEALRDSWKSRFAEGDFAALAADTQLMDFARPAAARLFADNCAACHGAQGQGKDGDGGTGFPALDDGDWLWSSDPADIAELIRVGINSSHDETNVSQMAAFGKDGVLERDQIDQLAQYVAALHTGKADQNGPAAALFEENCASCHGERGEGEMGVGAPRLSDNDWIYGGSLQDIRTTLMNGRQGVMPAWEGRLSQADRNLLALYVSGLAAQKEAAK